MPRSQALSEGLEYYYDEEAAVRPERFFEFFLRHTKGKFAGKPFVCLDWQREMLRELFGWRRVDNGLRRYRTAYISTAKKNGKTTTLAGLALYLTIADGEAGAECYSVASDVSQASIAFREAQLMVNANHQLRSAVKTNTTRRQITCPQNSGFYRVLPGDGFRTEGINAHAILFDELHSQRNRLLYDALRWAGAAREQPLFIATTTAGFDKNSICHEMYSHAQRVAADWKYDPTFFSFICEAEEGADWKDEKSWKAANPSWGLTIDPQAFANDFREAEASTQRENAFRRYRLNQWVAQETRFLNMDAWAACSGGPAKPTAGRQCWVGLDLATSLDTSAMVAVFADEDDEGKEVYDVVCRFWLPEENAKQRELRDKVPYLTWAKDPANGLTFTPGDVTDFDFIRRDIVAFAKEHDVKVIHLDRWNATQLATQLSDQDGLNVVGFTQSMAHLSAPTKMLENLVLSKRIRHAGNKVLEFHANNCSVKTDPSGNIRPVKPKKNSTQRVDGIVSLVMALAGLSSQRAEQAKPVPQIVIL